MPDQPQPAPLPAGEKRVFRSFSREEMALVCITVLWGVTFLVVHTAMRYTGPMFFVGLRFTTAALLSMLLFRRLLLDLTCGKCRRGPVWGWPFFWLCAANSGAWEHFQQPVGLYYGYVCAYCAVFAVVFPAQTPSSYGVAGGAVCFFWSGVANRSAGHSHMHLQFGEVVTLVSAVAIAMEVVLISRFASPAINSFRVAIVQLLVAGLLAFAAMPIMHEHVPALTWWWVLPGLGLGAMSAVIQLVMNWAQKTVSPTRATLIYAGEPVWAGLVGRLAGDMLPARALAGGALVILGVLASEVRLPRRQGRGRKGRSL